MPKKEKETVTVYNNMCFACSPVNPIGLRLEFQMDGDVCRTIFCAGERHQGWSGYMHGGLIATLLDEVMAQLLWQKDIWAMTAEMTTRFSLAVPVGWELTAEGRLLSERGRLIELEARLLLPDGRVAVRARAKFLRVKKSELYPEGLIEGASDHAGEGRLGE